MSKIVITSDLHLGMTRISTIRELVNRIASEEPTLTVLAGDVGEGLPNFVECLKLFAQLPGDVAVLAGNHDLWERTNYSSQDLWERYLPEAVRNAGMIWLEETVWQHQRVAVAGSLAWYDYSAADPTISRYSPDVFAAEKRNYNMDAAYVHLPWSDQEFARQLGDALCERLQKLEDDSDVSGVLVVSHMPLFEKQMYRKPHDFHWGFSNAYFGNLSLGQRVLKVSKVRAVISGHTHIGLNGQVRRPNAPKGETVSVSVLASDYDMPVHTSIDANTLKKGG